MTVLDLPLVIEADELAPLLGQDGLLVIDLCQEPTYNQYHIPGAVHIEYGQIIASNPPGAWFAARGVWLRTTIFSYRR